MQVLVSTDNHITGSDSLTSRVQAIVDDTLSRFGDRITRAEVHLSDESSAAKGGDADKRCMIEVRLAGMQPISASDRSNSLFEAVNGAARKLQSTPDRTLGKRSER
jgi:ribosome-associated translation inhibitor RaiA